MKFDNLTIAEETKVSISFPVLNLIKIQYDKV